jgi:coenzyme F420-dependent glucose-6-phosphate dehydrogenase
MPSVIQLHLSWAEARSQTDEQVVKEWSNGGIPFPKANIRDHEDYYCVDLGFDEVYAHYVGRNQEFIRAYGECVIPKLHLPEMG